MKVKENISSSNWLKRILSIGAQPTPEYLAPQGTWEVKDDAIRMIIDTLVKRLGLVAAAYFAIALALSQCTGRSPLELAGLIEGAGTNAGVSGYVASEGIPGNNNNYNSGGEPDLWLDQSTPVSDYGGNQSMGEGVHSHVVDEVRLLMDIQEVLPEGGDPYICTYFYGGAFPLRPERPYGMIQYAFSPDGETSYIVTEGGEAYVLAPGCSGGGNVFSGPIDEDYLQSAYLPGWQRTLNNQQNNQP